MTTNSFIVSNVIISQAAFIEAQELYLKGDIPFNFSNNTQLQDLVTKSLEDGQIDIEAYNSITDQLNFSYLEYDEAVLLGVLELISLSK